MMPHEGQFRHTTWLGNDENWPNSQIPQCTSPISHNAPVPYPTMSHFVTEMCTCVHISVSKWCIVGYLSDALWDLQDGTWDHIASTSFRHHFDGLMQKRCNSSALAMELHVFCIKSSILWWCSQDMHYWPVLRVIHWSLGGWIPFTKGQ